VIGSLGSWKLFAATVIMLVCLLYPSPTVGTFAFTMVDYMHGFGAALLICVALGKAALSEGLKHPVLVWLGRISYSLYLVHLPIIYALNQTIGGSWSFVELSAVAGLLSLLAAEVMFRIIELPGIRLGKLAGLRTLTAAT
jgi:peptidoglycan/LPS O-acetylase OafA/YrhL